MKDKIYVIIQRVEMKRLKPREALEEICSLLDINKYVAMQKCPKCDGQGIVSKPPWIAGDQNQWDSTSVNHQCDVCNGQKIILMQLNENIT